MASQPSPNAYNAFDINIGSFKGLFTALDASLIPDGYCAAMKNVKIDDFGVAHSVMKPTIVTPTAPFPLPYVTRISKPSSSVYVVVNDGFLYNLAGTLKWSFVDTGSPRAVMFVGGEFVNDYRDGLVGLTGTPAAIATANTESAPVHSSAICVYKDRLYFTMGSILRWSHPSNGNLASTWSGEHLNNFLNVVFSGYIIALAPTESGLFIFTSGRAYCLTEPKTGSFYEIYSGPEIPDINYLGAGYCDGAAYYYATKRGLYAFNGSPKLLSSVLTIDSGKSFVGYYDHRLWFLCTVPSGNPATTMNPIYALNTITGAWEQYEGWTGTGTITNFVSLLGGGDSVYTDQEALYLGAYDTAAGGSGLFIYGGGIAATTSVWPWEFTTKNFTPSLDAYSRPKYVKLTYAGQTASSVATIQFYVDGTLADTVTQDMAGSGLYHKEIEVNPHTPAGALGNSFQMRVSGAGTMDIKDCGVEFNPRGKGENSGRTP